MQNFFDCDIINIYLDTADAEDIESLFSEVTNCFDTDVTISDYFSACEDIRLHLGVPFTGLMSEVNACFQKLFNRNNCHTKIPPFYLPFRTV